MALLYNISLDELIDFDLDVNEIQEAIDKTSQKAEAKMNWTQAWGKRYPILLEYQSKVNVTDYACRISAMLEELRQNNQLSAQDAMLVLKDILYHVYKGENAID